MLVCTSHLNDNFPRLVFEPDQERFSAFRLQTERDVERFLP